MNKLLLLLFTVVGGISLNAQVTFIVDSLPDGTPPNDQIYIAGSMNGWNPGDENFRLTKNSNNLFQITLDAEPEGTTIEFKFTRGSWETVEKGINGKEIDNRTFTYGNGDTIHVVILHQRNNRTENSAATNKAHVVNIDKIKDQENINIFPNPVDKLVQFPKEITYGTNDSLTITDVTGRTLVEISSFKGESIPVCGLDAGVYFVTIRTANTVYTGEFIKN
jgi:hypothetical protein